MHTKGNRTGAALTILLTCVVALSVELIKFTGPQFDLLMSRSGVPVAALVALATFVCPALFTTFLVARSGSGGPAIWASAVSLVALRIAAQYSSGNLLLWIGLAAAAVSLSAVIVVASVCTRFAASIIARAITFGLAINAGLSLFANTYDSLWNGALWTFTPVVLLCALTLAFAWLLRGTKTSPHTRGLWSIGIVLMLGIMVFANSAFVASQANVPLWIAVLSILGFVALSTVVTRTTPQPIGLHCLIAVLGLSTIYLVPAWPTPSGVLITITVLLCSALVGASVMALMTTVIERSQRRDALPALPAVSAGAGLLLVLPILLFQLDYDMPLPVDNAFVIIVPALVLALGALRAVRYERTAGILPSHYSEQVTSRSASRINATLTAGAALLLVAGALVVAPLGKPAQATSAPGEVTLLNWNLHYGVSLEGQLEWNKVVKVIETSNADVVTLQEVSRGWFLGGGGDMLTYLSNELDMHVEFVGAADLQFGNAILWKNGIQVHDVKRTALEYGSGPQARSALTATLTVNDTDVQVTSVHLQHRDENTPTRLLQIQDLFEDVQLTSAWIIAGDFNAEPGWPEIQFLEEKGFVSAIDQAGDPNSATFPSTLPQQRIDWVFSSGSTPKSASVLQSDASDHLPILTTVVVN